MAFSSNRPSSPQQGHPAIQLPDVLAIGFTGHRKLPDEAASRILIQDFLETQKNSFAGIVYGVCCLAEGGDLLFAESCLALDIPIRVLLPLPAESFANDFDAAAWARVEQAMQQAVSIEITGSSKQRDERYYECGIATVQQSQLLLALWNAEPSGGRGGTGEIVDYARQIGHKVVWVHSITGQVETFNAKSAHAKKHDPELTFLRNLPDRGVSAASASPHDLATAWLTKIDSNASQFAPQVRRMAAMPIVCTAIAAVASGATSRLHASGGWLVASMVLGLAAPLLPALLRLEHRQLLWARTRTAAEVCRSSMALWDTPELCQVIAHEAIPELSGMLMTLNLLKALGTSRATFSLETFKQGYLEDRVADQMRYFARHAKQSGHDARNFRLISKACIGCALLLTAWTFFQEHFFGASASHHLFRQWLALGSSILFQAATVNGALLIVYDCDRRQRRYQELHDSLREWAIELQPLHTWHPAMQIVRKIENALMTEMLEWKSVIRNRKMPKD